MSARPKRKVQIKSEVPIKVPRKWSDKEMETLLSCIMQYGHKNLEKIQESLPGRSIENIKTFMRTVHDTAGKINNNNKEVLDGWLKCCEAVGGIAWKDSLQIAQVMKYLSIDGLIENHPLPERCQGIDFRQAYRLVYQALMGYPIQPVNRATADFIIETMVELSGEVKKQVDAIKKVDAFLDCEAQDDKQNSNAVQSDNPDVKTSNIAVKKPVKVYQRKKLTSTNTETVPSLKIIVEEKPEGNNSSIGCSKDFSITVEGSSSSQSTTTLHVPVPPEATVDKDEEELLKSSSFNPFKIPEKWLKEPLYLNLVQNL